MAILLLRPLGPGNSGDDSKATANPDSTLTIVRVVMGFVFFAHGAQKMLGWFGGPDFDGTVQTFSQRMGIPVMVAVLAILAEFLGGIGLVFGLLARIASFGIAVNMIVAVLLVHLRNGLFMNWQGSQPGEGFEYHVLAIWIAILVDGPRCRSLVAPPCHRGAA